MYFVLRLKIVYAVVHKALEVMFIGLKGKLHAKSISHTAQLALLVTN